jgi:hypothetical protein
VNFFTRETLIRSAHRKAYDVNPYLTTPTSSWTIDAENGYKSKLVAEEFYSSNRKSFEQVTSSARALLSLCFLMKKSEAQMKFSAFYLPS